VKTDKADKAKINLAKLLTDYPETALADQAHYRLGEIAYAADDHKTAIAEYETVATKFTESAFAPFALYGKAWAQLKSKAFAEGGESFTALLTKFPEHQLKAEAQLGRAMCRRQAGDPKGAIADLDEYLKSNPEQPKKSDALYERGLAQVAASDFAGAIATLDGPRKADPKYAAADKFRRLGQQVAEKHAEAVYRQDRGGTRRQPLAAKRRSTLARINTTKKYVEAISRMPRSRKSPSELEKATYKLGWSHFQQKQYADALTNFSEQIAAFPQGPLAADAIFMKAESLFRQEAYKEAWPAYQAAVKTKASTPAIEVLMLLHGGQSAAQLKLWDESLKLLASIPEKFPESPLLAEAIYEAGWAQQNLGKNDEALKNYSRDEIARSCRRAGPLHDGRAALRRQEARRRHPRVPAGHVRLRRRAGDARDEELASQERLRSRPLRRGADHRSQGRHRQAEGDRRRQAAVHVRCREARHHGWPRRPERLDVLAKL
jgi:TolA-binding protein